MQIYRSEVSNAFVDTFKGKMNLNEEEFLHLLSYFRREYLPKKYFYRKEGEITHQKAYINLGCTRTFTMDDKGREHILFFSFEDWWIGDFESYVTGNPGIQYIQAIEDCELLCISKANFSKAEQEITKLKMWYEVKQAKMFSSTLQRLNEVKSLSPEERYIKLLEKHPHIFQRIPLQYIASYLNIEPPSLSRLRKRLLCKQLS